MYEIVCGTLNDPAFAARYAEPMFRQRYRVFRERLGWDVQDRDGLERDGYDDADTRYVLLTAHGALVGGWRLRPSTGPYMLADVFPELLHGQPAPRHERVWEISRFAMEDGGARGAFGLNGAARALLRATAAFAVGNGIERYVLVASAAAERLYRHLGLVVHRFGPPLRIGCVRSVAGWIDVDAHTRHLLLGEPLPLKAAA